MSEERKLSVINSDDKKFHSLSRTFSGQTGIRRQYCCFNETNDKMRLCLLGLPFSLFLLSNAVCHLGLFGRGKKSKAPATSAQTKARSRDSINTVFTTNSDGGESGRRNVKRLSAQTSLSTQLVLRKRDSKATTSSSGEALVLTLVIGGRGREKEGEGAVGRERRGEREGERGQEGERGGKEREGGRENSCW